MRKHERPERSSDIATLIERLRKLRAFVATFYGEGHADCEAMDRTISIVEQAVGCVEVAAEHAQGIEQQRKDHGAELAAGENNTGSSPTETASLECDQCDLKQSEWELPLVEGASCPRHYLDDDSCDGVIRASRLIHRRRFDAEIHGDSVQLADDHGNGFWFPLSETPDLVSVVARLQALAGNQASTSGIASTAASSALKTSSSSDVDSRATHAEARQQWQPIETAPKDGTMVWLAYRALKGPNAIPGSWRENRNWWWTEVGNIEPTHWMPYWKPSPPEAK